MLKSDKHYVIGVDGGGTKTVTALSDQSGEIFKMVETGPSSPRNVGIDRTVENVALGIKKILGRKKQGIDFIFAGLPSIEEEYFSKSKEIEEKILKEISIKTKIKVGSDQLVAFRSGTDEKNGVAVIAGTGCVAHGWRGGRDLKSSGWGWFFDEGSGVWVGRKVLQKVFRDIDNRDSKTELTKMVLKELDVSTPEKLAQKIYFSVETIKNKKQEDFLKIISSLSKIADEAAEKGDIAAREILREAGDEISLAVNTVVKKLGFKNKKFSLVLVGSMFLSKNFRKTFELYVAKTTNKANLIYPENPPVFGAIKLAIDYSQKEMSLTNPKK